MVVNNKLEITTLKTFLIFGPPSGGKGTLLEKIITTFKITAIGCGDICRAEKKKNSVLYREAQEHMRITRSTLWPTEPLMKASEPHYFDATEQGSVIWDGFLRHVDQVPHLIRLASHTDQGVVLIDVQTPDDVCVNRALERKRLDDVDIHERLRDFHDYSVPARNELLKSASSFPIERIIFIGETPIKSPDYNNFVHGIGLVYGLQKKESLISK